MEEIFFGANLKFLRGLDNLKQADMWSVAGFKQSAWGGYETAVSTPSVSDLIKISGFFGVLESDLLHTDISKSDLNTLYFNYISTQKQPLLLGNTPRSKAFKQYFLNVFQAEVPPQKPGIVPESVPFPVPNGPKNHKKGITYSTQNEAKTAAMAAEPPGKYHTGGKRSDTDEIAELKRVLAGIKAILNTWTP